MNPTIGFVLLTHDKPAQIQRLARRLGELYPDAPIACHHDSSKAPLDGVEFPGQVRFVRPHVVTSWGNFSLVFAFRAALHLVYDSPNAPDWFTFLSGSDYPVRAPGQVLHDLEFYGADAYMHHLLVERPFVPDPKVQYDERALKSMAWSARAYDRYVATPLWPPGLSLASRDPAKMRLLRWKILERWLTPFHNGIRCFGGEAWFTANRRAAEAILSDSGIVPRLDKHFKRKYIPDEAINQTILCNRPGLRICQGAFRYVDWSHGGAHPKFLGMEDLPRIFASGAHFARKFDWETCQSALDAIDEQVNRAVAKTAMD